MKKYIKPSAEIVELSIKESLSKLTSKKETRTFGFGSTPNKSVSLTSYATAQISVIKKVNG